MRKAAIALVCVLSASAVAKADDPVHAPSDPALFTGIANPTKLSDASKGTEPARGRGDQTRRIELPKGRVCFNASETREKIGSHHLAEPFRALRSSRSQGEALKVKLCRWKQDDYVYEVSILRRDGRIMHVYMNAQNGQSLGTTGDTDRK